MFPGRWQCGRSGDRRRGTVIEGERSNLCGEHTPPKCILSGIRNLKGQNRRVVGGVIPNKSKIKPAGYRTSGNRAAKLPPSPFQPGLSPCLAPVPASARYPSARPWELHGQGGPPALRGRDLYPSRDLHNPQTRAPVPYKTSRGIPGAAARTVQHRRGFAERGGGADPARGLRTRGCKTPHKCGVRKRGRPSDPASGGVGGLGARSRFFPSEDEPHGCLGAPRSPLPALSGASAAIRSLPAGGRGWSGPPAVRPPAPPRRSAPPRWAAPLPVPPGGAGLAGGGPSGLRLCRGVGKRLREGLLCWRCGAEACRAGVPPDLFISAPHRPVPTMKRPCEETTSDSDMDETIDVGSENNYSG